jgi:hypothetical protein
MNTGGYDALGNLRQATTNMIRRMSSAELRDEEMAGGKQEITA